MPALGTLLAPMSMPGIRTYRGVLPSLRVMTESCSGASPSVVVLYATGSGAPKPGEDVSGRMSPNGIMSVPLSSNDVPMSVPRML